MNEIYLDEYYLSNINTEIRSKYLPLTKKGYTKRKMNFNNKLTLKNKLSLKLIDNLTHSETVQYLVNRNIINEDSTAPTHLLKNMMVAMIL